jgi:DNA-directed RNA polymerase II subunit RPB1
MAKIMFILFDIFNMFCNTNSMSRVPQRAKRVGVHVRPVDEKLQEERHLNQEFKKKMKDLPNVTISGATVRIYSWDDIVGLAGSIVVTSGNKLEEYGSVNDQRMGVVDSNERCENCFKIDCEGHFGIAKFPRPICNPIFIKEINNILKCVCHTCGRLLMKKELLENKGFLNLQGEARFLAIKTYCEKNRVCKRTEEEKWVGCGQRRGATIKCEQNPIYITKTKKDEEFGLIKYTNDKKVSNKESSNVEIKPVSAVLELFNCIPVEDIVLMGFDKTFHPRDLIMRGLPIIPLIARPPSIEDGVVYVDQITSVYKEIVNKISKQSKDPSHDQNLDMDIYDKLKRLYFKSSDTGTNKSEFLSISERLQGKEGIFRKSLMGKVCGNCGRGVAGPDVALEFGEVGIPSGIARKNTKPIKITSWNRDHVIRLSKEGSVVNYISKGIRYAFNPKKTYEFAIGDEIERELKDGDRIIINRQPTLHAPSIMGHQVKIHNGTNIRAPLAITPPMNLDFDGDEMNDWAPQSPDVDAEVAELMDVKSNIISRENNKPSMGLVMNSVVGSYMMCRPHVKVTEGMLQDFKDLLTRKTDLDTIDERLERYQIDHLSGRGVLSILFPPDFYYNQGSVVILEGILVEGMLTKAHVGPSHRSIIQELHKKYGKLRAAEFITCAPWIINRWLMEHGLSVSLKDMIVIETDPNTGKKVNRAERVVNAEMSMIRLKIASIGPKQEDKDLEEQRQRDISAALNVSISIGRNLAKDILKPDNSVRIMGDEGSGTKGSLSQMAQMIGLVGQQFLNNQRLQPSITNNTRLFVCFAPHDESPEANGFVRQSLIKGVGIVELYAMCQAAREALVKGSLEPATTGDSQRKQVKALENILTAYDGSIRNNVGSIFSTTFNCGFSISEMVKVEEIPRFCDLRNIIREHNASKGWVHKSVVKSGNLVQEIGKKRKIKAVEYQVREPLFLNLDQKITKFERTRLIGARARQLANNDQPKIEIIDSDLYDATRIATREYDQGLIDICAIRKDALGNVNMVYPTLENIAAY